MRTRRYHVSSPTIIAHRFFFFNDTATTEIYTLSLHDALPISSRTLLRGVESVEARWLQSVAARVRSEEHTSELQSLAYLVCRLLLEKKKNKRNQPGFDKAAFILVQHVLR